VVLHYHLKDKPAKDAKIALEILQSDGTLIRRFSPKAEQPGDKLEPKQGMNRLVWDLRYPPAESFPGMIHWGGGVQGPRAVPATYQARLQVGDQTQVVNFEVKPDPRSAASLDDYAAQFRFLLAARDKLSDTHRAIKQIRDVRDQVTNVSKRVKDREEFKDVTDAAKAVDQKLTSIEEALYQTKNRSPQDVLNYPIRLNNRLSALAGMVSMGDNRPTDQAVQLLGELTAQINTELGRLRRVIDEDVYRFNELVAKKRIPAVFTEPDKSKESKPPQE
jgi:hypothetical protein